MNVTAWLDSLQPALFETRMPHGRLKRLLGRMLSVANAGAAGLALGSFRSAFYDLKRRLLERYGEPDGTDWQEIVRNCWGCEACCKDPDDSYYAGRYACCDGKGIYSRKWIPLARHRLGSFVFHTPGAATYEKPDARVKYKGLVKHREVSQEDARAAFCVLCLVFDRDLFRKCAAQLFAMEYPEANFYRTVTA